MNDFIDSFDSTKTVVDFFTVKRYESFFNKTILLATVTDVGDYKMAVYLTNTNGDAINIFSTLELICDFVELQNTMSSKQVEVLWSPSYEIAERLTLVYIPFRQMR